jgi:glucosyl-3-phosphoglycerate synthase
MLMGADGTGSGGTLLRSGHGRHDHRPVTPPLRATGPTTPARTTPLRTVAAAEADVDRGRLLEAKRSSGAVVSVCIPARDEERTVGDVVGAIVSDLAGPAPLVDEVLVVDDGSQDRTAAVARAAGAVVVAAGDVLPETGPGTGKGEALWKSLAASSGDIVLWCDADVRSFDTRFVTRLLAPLLLDEGVQFTKGFYERPTQGGVGGGRVTELVARPVISLLLPALAPFVQPLSGEYGGRRSVLERLPFEQGYGVELGLLADLADHVGMAAMAQVDLGTRAHRNRPLAELSPQAAAVLRAAFRRSGVSFEDPTVLHLPDLTRIVADGTRPALVEVPGYARRVS